MHNILIIDDNKTLCRTLAKTVSRLGMKASYETTLQDGLRRAARADFDVVFLDVKLPDGNGLDGIERLRRGSFPPEVIIITGHGSGNGAETAIRSGAWDYIEKRSSFQNVRLALTRAIQYREQKRESPRRVALKRESIVGGSPRITDCLDQVAQAAGSDGPVLILGETGTGKELFSRTVHENSGRSAGPFVVVDCAALPDNLVESMLFGHKKGAFTGAQSDHEGLVRQADRGTLFLDEIGELPWAVQKTFLRVLQEKRFRPLGSKRETSSDFRLVCATNRDLAAMVDQERFREDLYYRVRSLQIDLPPLRVRKEDIPSLVLHHIGRRSGVPGAPSHGFSPEFLEALLAHDWPGNVRELFHTVDRVLSAARDEPVLFPKHLPAGIRTAAVKKQLRSDLPRVPADAAAPGVSPGPMLPMKQHMEETRRRYVEALMRSTGGDVPAACRVSGLSRAYLYELLGKYGLRTP